MQETNTDNQQIELTVDDFFSDLNIQENNNNYPIELALSLYEDKREKIYKQLQIEKIQSKIKNKNKNEEFDLIFENKNKSDDALNEFTQYLSECEEEEEIAEEVDVDEENEEESGHSVEMESRAFLSSVIDLKKDKKIPLFEVEEFKKQEIEEFLPDKKSVKRILLGKGIENLFGFEQNFDHLNK